MVAFTELTPADSLKLMRWRPRWSRWSFEPYGIAITREAAANIGARPVRYVDETEWKSFADAEKPFSHRRGRKADIWPAECEWRIAGDVDLSAIPAEDIRLLVRDHAERDTIQPHCSYRVYSLQ
jgi:hypothetical protein